MSKTPASSPPQTPHADLVNERVARLVMPHVVAIYAPHHRDGDDARPVQVGTGFLVEHNGRAALLTARHVVRGRTFAEEPGEKAVLFGELKKLPGDKAMVVDGEWTYFWKPPRTFVEDAASDLAAAYADEFALDRCLPASALDELVTAPGSAPRPLAMAGFLSRDFKRSGGGLNPKPWSFLDKGLAVGSGMVGMAYDRRGMVDAVTKERVFPPEPRGLSGCPMVDAGELACGRVRVVGVFTEQDRGQARGADSAAVRALLARL